MQVKIYGIRTGVIQYSDKKVIFSFPAKEMNETIKPPKHLFYLDSMRGLAALLVMIFHFINWKYADKLPVQIASVVFNGPDAVSFFFVLSGFVLSYKYVVCDYALDLRKFYVKRYFRLWPPFFITVLLNALNWMKYDISSDKLKEVFLNNSTQFWNEALLLRPHTQYFVPGWTLVVELAFSFAVPFIIVISYRNTRLLAGLLVATLLAGYSVGAWYIYNFHFCLGVLAASLYTQVRNEDFKNSIWYRRRSLFLVIAIALFFLRGIYNIIPLGFGKSYDHITMYLGIGFYEYTALSAFIVILSVICSPVTQAVLENRLLLFIGKISYGIYLMHWTFLGDIFSSWKEIVSIFPGPKTAFIVVFICYCIVTIVLATLMHYFVEIPFIKIGKWLADKLKPSLVIAR